MQFVMNNLGLIITLVILGVIGLVTLWCAGRGMLCGTIRTTIRLLTVFLSAGIAIFGVSILSTTVLPSIEPAIKAYVVDFLTGLSPAVADMINSSQDLVNYILELVMALITPMLFTCLFIVLLIITLPVYWFLKIFIPKAKDEQGNKKKLALASRFGGAGIALIGGAIISICVLMPVTGYIAFVSEEYPIVMESGFVNEEVIPEQLSTGITESKDNFAVKAVNACGGNLLFKTMTKVGENYATDEIDYMLVTVKVTIPAVQQLMDDNAHVMDNNEMHPLQLNALQETILPQLEKAPLRVRKILAEILCVGAGKWKNNETFLGVSLGEMLGDEIASSVTILLEDLSRTQGEVVIRDLHDFSVTAEDLSLCLSYFKEIRDNNPTELVSQGKQKLDLSIIRTKVLPTIDGSEASAVERAFLADVMRNAAVKWQAGETYLDVDLKSILGNFSNSGDSILVRLSETDADHIIEDLSAVSRDIEVLSQTYVYFVDMQDQVKDNETLKNDLKEIVVDMTPEAVEVIKTTLSQEISESVEIQEKDAVVDLIGSAFENVAALPTDEQKEKEADALNQVLNYATGNATGEEAEEDVVDAMLTSTAISSTIIDTVNKNNDPATAEEDKTQISITAEQKAQLDAAINERLEADDALPANQKTLSDEQKAMLESLKQLFITAPAGQ